MGTNGGILVIVILAGAIVFFLALAGRRRRIRRLAQELLETTAPLRDAPRDDYLRASTVQSWKDSHLGRAALRIGRELRLLSAARRTPELEDAVAIARDVDFWARVRNDLYVAQQSRDLAQWFETAFSTPLTEAQRKAVITDEDANLVVAGAGCGKTTVLVAKVAYLMEHRGVQPSDILILAFNRSVAEELRQRMDALGMASPEVATFHAKGFELLGRAWGRKPAVSALAADDLALFQLLQQRFQALLRQRAFRKEFSRWWVELRVDASELKECETQAERLDRERSLGLRALDGTLLRSQAEVKVGDWLTLQGVRWENEKRYSLHEGSPDYRDYTPDFYLPDYDAWLEVWACDRKEERFPPHIDPKRYREGMSWKRTLHDKHGTVLIELFQDDIWQKKLGPTLQSALDSVPTSVEPLTEEETEALLTAVNSNVHPFIKLIASFLRLYRAGGWSPQRLGKQAKTRRDAGFLRLFWPFLACYEEALEEEGKIDFDAMLLEAGSALATNAAQAGYRYILVDEFQDTSLARLDLVRGLRGSRSECRLFLVGDDWQSIYRFAGSDVSYFTSVQRYVGATERTDLDKTFRLESDVAHLSMRFVTKNPAQLRKTLAPRGESSEPGVVLHFHGGGEEVATLASILKGIGLEDEDASVLVLARYNHRLAPVDELKATFPEGLSVQALTAHRAKGLEADHVIVLGLDGGTYGFPSEISDDRVLEMLLGDAEGYPNGEERRLFYVALTRTRSKVHVLADNSSPSPFIQELLGDEYAEWVYVSGEERKRYRCPRCLGRTIRRREGEFGPFWGCNSYSEDPDTACLGRLPVCPQCESGVVEPLGVGSEAFACTGCGRESPRCPGCGLGVLLERSGQYGLFLGCSEWRLDGSGCGFTRGAPRGP